MSENHNCPNCHVPAAYLGTLGYYEYWRCQFCGTQITVDRSPLRYKKQAKRQARQRRAERKAKEQAHLTTE